jgi:hypothetical protein
LEEAFGSSRRECNISSASFNATLQRFVGSQYT